MGAIARRYRAWEPDLPWFDVTMFGADPTGRSDATAAMQACINAAAGCGGVWIPPGVYHISALNVPSNSHILMDPAANVLRTVPGATFRLSNVSSVVIEGGTLELTTPNLGQYIVATNSSNIKILNVRAGTQLAGTPMFWLTQNVTNVLISGCQLLNPRTDLSQNDGIHLGQCDSVLITDCIIATGDDAISVGSLGGTSDGTGACQHVTISNCVLQAGSRCIALYTLSASLTTNDITVTGCTGFTQNPGAPKILVANVFDTSLTRVQKIAITGCVFTWIGEPTGNGAYHYLIQNASNVSICNCPMVTSGVSNAGAGLANAQQCIVSNSIITGNNTGILESSAANFNLYVGNYLRGNTIVSSGLGANSLLAGNLT